MKDMDAKKSVLQEIMKWADSEMLEDLLKKGKGEEEPKAVEVAVTSAEPVEDDDEKGEQEEPRELDGEYGKEEGDTEEFAEEADDEDDEEIDEDELRRLFGKA